MKLYVTFLDVKQRFLKKPLDFYFSVDILVTHEGIYMSNYDYIKELCGTYQDDWVVEQIAEELSARDDKIATLEQRVADLQLLLRNSNAMREAAIAFKNGTHVRNFKELMAEHAAHNETKKKLKDAEQLIEELKCKITSSN
jgi:hypothetical protein